jgi:catechol 2,3-dioxygenase-like lactoylglutathione lyase family enzyme
VGLKVPDIEASVKWYEEMLGFKLVKRLDLTLPGSDTVTRMAWIKNGDFYVEFFEDRMSPPFSMESYRNTLGVKHMSFIVPNFAELVAHLKQKGVRFLVDGHWPTTTVQKTRAATSPISWITLASLSSSNRCSTR